MPDIENVVIIGSGPAGYTAALYAARAGLEPLVIAGLQPGGQLMITTEVENYPGFPEGLLGPDMMELFQKQAERFGAKVVFEHATAVDFKNAPYTITAGDKTYRGRTVIVATGAT